MPATDHLLRVGIAITTYNRREQVCRQIEHIRRFTSGAYELVICDDGSTDGTPQTLRDLGEAVIAGVNRGIAWNKNRGIFYLMALRGCDVAILLDDDMLPEEPAWQARWVEGALRWGHVNFIAPGLVPGVEAAACTAAKPGAVGRLLGSCIAFSRYPWSLVGYMDTRFGRYGHEHTEFTNRFLRNGFGGIIREGAREPAHYYYVISGGIRLLAGTSSGSAADVAANATIWRQIIAERAHTYRPPWRNDPQRLEFITEMRLAVQERGLAVPYQSEGFLFF
ncbi:glycosyltransferase family 2 protein [Acidocella sp.]|uniref:glycosyltransferase family 2 protein n=1 Tax=Acidocella sp. TaxID=50710 RepID=UPI00260D52D8|nr:glycosyltransferase [Acidocella sp.]